LEQSASLAQWTGLLELVVVCSGRTTRDDGHDGTVHDCRDEAARID
jgi:hypothetical protein